MNAAFLRNWQLFTVLLLVFLLANSRQTSAFHIKAGDITAKSDTVNPANPLRFHFKMVTYIDGSRTYEDKEAIFFFSDGTQEKVKRDSIYQLPNNTLRQVFYVSHTFPAPGVYNILYSEAYRTSGILNIPNSNTTTFLITTTVTITPQIGINRLPQFTVPPLDVAASGQIFVHFPGAYDLDQDSISYKLVTPMGNYGMQSKPTPSNVAQYTLPNDPTYGGTTIADPVTGATANNPPRFDLNPVTGEIRWNVPNMLGMYNIAFIVEEWRRVPGKKAVKLGFITRDMQIKVEATSNLRPVVLVPKDTCVVAKTQVRATVTGSDPNSPPDPLTFNAYGGILPPATFTQTGNVATFQWTPQCSDISEYPHRVIFKATDNPQGQAPKLVDMQAWNVKVVGPKPTGLTTTLQPNRQMQLTWDPYQVNVCGNAEKIHIYRRLYKANFTPSTCQTGVPASTGYVKIGEVPASASSFLDTNNGAGLKPGLTYCYVIYATFPAPKKGESLASLEACADVPALGSLLTNVDVSQTSRTNGELVVKWTRPLKDSSNLNGPYEYRLYVKQGINSADNFKRIYSSSNLNDTIFTAYNHNTQDFAYHYKIEFYETGPNGLTLLEEGNEATSVRLSAESTGTSIELNWKYATPWNNSERKHIIYRQINNVFVPIDSVQAGVTSGTYTDKGTYNNQPLVLGQQYCYYIETVGTFTNPKLPPVVYNRSQIFCQTLRDTIPPCPPVLSLALLNCDSVQNSTFLPPFENKLKWNYSADQTCSKDVASFNVYGRHSEREDFRFLVNTKDLDFVHRNLTVPTGCYAVTAIDSSGNESSRSNVVCQEVCYALEFPNIISPNNDGMNDTFRPSQWAFIRSVKFTVYNRWGIQVFSKTTGPRIDWGSVTDGNSRVPDGIYYYLAEVEFAGQEGAGATKTYKGWVEVVR